MRYKSRRGGARKGAGRPKNAEKTKPVRIPESCISLVKNIIEQMKKLKSVEEDERIKFPVNLSRDAGISPLFLNKISAGSASTAESSLDRMLDLNSYLVRKPRSTFFIFAEGESMINAGISPGDMLVVEQVEDNVVGGSIVIAVINGELTVKRIQYSQHGIKLVPENPSYQPIEILEEDSFDVLGIVRHIIHSP